MHDSVRLTLLSALIDGRGRSTGEKIIPGAGSTASPKRCPRTMPLRALRARIDRELGQRYDWSVLTNLEFRHDIQATSLPITKALEYE